MRRRHLLCLLSLLFGTQLANALGFAELAQHTRSPETLSGAFHQTKYLTALDTSIKSNGRFRYRRGREIRWSTLAPVADELVMTPGAISGSGDGQSGLNASDNPTVALISQIFFAVMSADWPVLEQHFKLSGDLQGAAWHATLLPLDEAVGLVITQVKLSGDGYLRHLELLETSGDRVLIEFSDLKSE